MIDYDILKEFGTTDDRLREFFTAVEPTPAQAEAMTQEQLRVRRRDIRQRAKFEKWLQGILQEHIVNSLANHAKYAAVDMAWDSAPINRATVPLMQYAQGRLDLNKVDKWMKDVPNGDQFVRRNAAGECIGVDMPKFFEVNINLVRSIITRRRAAQVQKYDRLWPFFKYEPRDQTQVGKLRADATSQRMDIMADQYGYRHFNSQAILHMLLYTKCVAFPRSHWEREIQLERAPGDIQTDENGKILKRTRVVREGLSWVTPHPSRVFSDNNYPTTSLNEDTGCEYVGFWDVTRWGDIANNTDYFNRKKVAFSHGMCDLFTAYWPYFNQYFSTITPPTMPGTAETAVGGGVGATTMANDRKNQVGLFNSQMEMMSTIFSHISVKVRPQNWGWGKYPHPLWVHLKIAGDATVVYAKILPSSPAAVFSHNENDQRLFNISLAHEIMPYQDQLTNLTSQLLETIKQDLFSVCILNTDVFPDNAQGKMALQEFEKLMSNKATYTSMQMLEVSFKQMADLGIKPEQAFTVVRSEPNTAIEKIFEAITHLLNMADRLMVMSSQEIGQQMTHEASATESNNISKATDTIYDFISTGIDEGRAAMKRICFESAIACGSDQVELTVANRYPASVIEAAGFSVKSDAMSEPAGYTRLLGDKTNLVHDYIFTSRDGGDRPAGAQAAQVLVQMLQAIGSLEQDIQQAVVGAMGKAKVFEIFNQIFHSIDAGIDLNLELKPGEDDNLLISQNQQVMDALKRMAQSQQKDTQDINSIHQAIQALFTILGQTNPQAAAMVAQAMQQQQPTPPPAAPQPQL